MDAPAPAEAAISSMLAAQQLATPPEPEDDVPAVRLEGATLVAVGQNWSRLPGE